MNNVKIMKMPDAKENKQLNCNLKLQMFPVDLEASSY